ncbi:unnamed protein product [Discula destructiva]
MAPLNIDPESIPLSLASCSIGLPKHTLHQKLEAISQSGFQGIELSFPDLLAHVKELQSLHQLPAGEIKEDDWPTLAKTAEHIRHLCATHNLQIIVLQPFANFEGWPDQGPQRSAVFAKARGWAQIMKAAGTDLLQVGSTDTPAEHITADRGRLAADLAELADILAPDGLRIAYENWCWATHAPRWKDVWEIVQLADRPNIGLCLDTFQSAGGEWADPTTASGLLDESESESSSTTSSWRASVRELARTVPADKIFFLQISDAYRMTPPLSTQPDAESGLRPRGRWSHDYRPLPYDGGYLGEPMREFVRGVLETGFRGWFSVEVFDGEFESKYGDGLGRFAGMAREGTRRLVREAVGLEEGV